jgi:hypothetical protein
MTYLRTKKYSAERQRSMQAGRDRARMSKSAPARTEPLPDVRMRITVERMDPGAESVHVFTLRRARRVDQFAVMVDGKPWRVCGLSGVLEELRKATPRMLSTRAL